MPNCLMNCISSSMYPTLQVGDGMKVLPYNGRRIRPGDVVVFQHPGGKHFIVHRVVRLDGQGIHTRGDNQFDVDSLPLQPTHIIGRVAGVSRGDRTWSLAAGWRGQMVAAFARIRRLSISWTTKTLRPVYRGLVNSGLSRRFLGRQTSLRIFCFSRPKGVEMHLFLGRQPVGRWSADVKQWQIRAPFRLFIDEKSLPPSPSKFAACEPFFTGYAKLTRRVP